MRWSHCPRILRESDDVPANTLGFEAQCGTTQLGTAVLPPQLLELHRLAFWWQLIIILLPHAQSFVGKATDSMNSRWIEEACRFPVAFAQVREDPEIDLQLVGQTRRRARALIVGSGGCTTALLVACGDLEVLHVVDPNPSQLALVRFKLELLCRLHPINRLQILGHQAMDPSARHVQIAEILGRLGYSLDVFGSAQTVSQVGVDQCGRYEMLFVALRRALSRFTGQLEALAQSQDITEQTRLMAQDAELGAALDEALDRVLSLPNLVALFGPNATANRAEDFSRHFARRIRFLLGTMPARESPWLAQMLVGHFGSAQPYPWLTQHAPRSLPIIDWSQDTMQNVLASAEADDWDFIHLSNILDWLTPTQSALLLEHAWKALSPGGRIVIRQLNSALDIPAAAPQIGWLSNEAHLFHASDRSFFYRELHVGMKR